VLRRIVQLLATALIVGGAALMLAGAHPGGLQALILGLIIFVAVRFERWRDHPRPSPAGEQWQSTGERFEDPGSGKRVEVQYNAQTGERHYRSEGDS
jgi:hypothetical protein